MNQDNLQRKSQMDDMPEPVAQGVTCEGVEREKTVAGTGVAIQDLTPQKKSKLIITLLRRLDKQHKQIVAHQENNQSDKSEKDTAQAENVIRLLGADLDDVISALSKRVAKSQDIITTFSQSQKTEGQAKITPAVHAVEVVNSEPESATSNTTVSNTTAPDATISPEPDSKESDKAIDSVTSKPKPEPFPSYIPVYDEEDEDEEDDGVAEHLFSLVKYYENNIPEGEQSNQSIPVIEIVKLNGGEVGDVQYLKQGQSYSIDVAGKKFCLAKNINAQKLQFFFNEKFLKGEIRRKEADVNSGQQLVAESKGTNKLSIPNAEIVQINCAHEVYILRKVFPITSPEVKEISVQPFWKRHYRNIATSVAIHLLGLIIVGALFISPQLSKDKEEQPKFVKVDVQQLKKPKKPVVKTPKKVVKKKPAPKVAKKPAKKKQVAKRKVAKKAPPAPKAGGGNKKGGNLAKRNVKKTGLLAALGNKKGKKLGAKKALAKVSSLDAVSSLNAESGKLKIAGLTAKVEGARMTIPTGELIDTKGTSAVLRSGGVDGKGNIALMERGGTGQGKVNAMVSADLSKKVRVKGGMSREAVKKVIDAHMEEVVYCYETALLSNPGLAGKAVFEWTILMSGRVGETGIKSTTLRSDSVHSCISSAIKTWQFPKPNGSKVVVSYPFIFDMVGF